MPKDETLAKAEVVETLTGFVEDLTFKLKKGENRLSPKVKGQIQHQINFFKSTLFYIQEENEQ